MNIDIIDNAGALHVLEYEFNKKGIQLNRNEVISTITNSFKKIYKTIDTLFQDNPNQKIKVNLEQRSFTEDSIHLARIDVDVCTSDEFIFYIYFDTLEEIANTIHLKDSISEDINSFENTILHELIHAADLFTLKKIDNLLDKGGRLSKKRTNFEISFISEKDEESLNYEPLHWHFLNTINRFRNEGVAVLGQKLFGTILDRYYPEDQTELFVFFKRLMAKIQSITNENIFSINSNPEVYDELSEFSLHAYNIGDFILLKLIGKIEPELVDITEKAVKYILLDDEHKPTFEESKRLIDFAFQLDLTDYFSGLIGYHFNEIDQPFILKESLFEYCSLIQSDVNKEGLNSFSKNIAISGQNKSIDAFIDLMKETVFSKMSKDEIIAGYNQFILKESEENIVKTIKYQAELLYKRAIQDNNEIAQWALTYLLDDEDLVYDKITILGWQDDWLVLDAAIRIIYQ